jgi:signal transduction histidine kinase/ActR/RegA family two-component response regulator
MTAASESTPPDAMDVDALMRLRLFEALVPMLHVAGGLMLFFAVLNLFDMPPWLRQPIVIYDLVLAAACLATARWARRPQADERLGHPIGLLVLAGLAGNILTTLVLRPEPLNVYYIDVLIIVVGSAMSMWSWAIAAIALLWLTTVPCLVLIGVDVTMGLRLVASMVVATGLSVGILRSRIRKEVELSRALLGARRRREALREALAETEAARTALDARVEERTAELRKTNVALQEQVERAEDLAEQLRHAQRMEAIGRLAGGIAHDFNNLLAAITGNLEVALEDLPASVDRGPLRDAQLAARRAVDVTRKLLTFSRRQIQEARVFDLVPRLEEMERMLRSLLRDDVDLLLETPKAPCLVNGDAGQLEQVVLNLAVNARDAMPRGGRLELTLEDLGERLKLRVTDTGVGIPEEVQPKIFEPFFTTKPLGEGTGLGLATVYGIVQQHGGELRVESTVGAGTTFIVTLPRAREPAVEAVREASERPAPAGGETILLVEDEETVRRLGERVLRRRGYHVLPARDAETAMAVSEAHEGPIHLLFTDVLMPGMNGKDLADALLETRPEMGVLFASGYTGDDLKNTAGELQEGVNFLYKPYDLKDLTELVRRILDGGSSGAGAVGEVDAKRALSPA